MTKPLFKYVGGKARMIPHYQPYMPRDVRAYCEPFLGGGSMFLHVMENYSPDFAVIGDADDDLMNLYLAIREFPRQFIQAARPMVDAFMRMDYEQRKAMYYEVRELHAWHPRDRAADPELASMLYFLFHTCFNGMYQRNHTTNGRFGTACGHLQHGNHFLDEDNVMDWHALLRRAEVRCGGWLSTVQAFALPTDAFVFMDPPYRGAALKPAYMKDFKTDGDHLVLLGFAEGLADVGKRVFLCNRDDGDGFWEANRGGLRVEYFDRRSTLGRGAASNPVREVLLHNAAGEESMMASFFQEGEVT